MKVLAIDTSTLVSSVAVLEDNVVLGELNLNQDMSHSENLIPMIDIVLKNIGLDIEDIDLFAVAVGPGSFTGLRIGIATVKSFAQTLKKPIVGVSTLEGLSYSLLGNETIVSMIDARRDRVYASCYRGLVELELEKEEAIYKIDDLLESLKVYKNIVINGNASLIFKDKIEKELSGIARLAQGSLNGCRASAIAELGLEKYRKNQVDDYHTILPEYVRETQAQRELDEKRKQECLLK